MANVNNLRLKVVMSSKVGKANHMSPKISHMSLKVAKTKNMSLKVAKTDCIYESKGFKYQVYR